MLPDWPEGTVAVLSTAAGPPHAIPVSTAVRSGDATIHLALALRRESLARLRENPRCALTLLAPGVAVTAHAGAAVVEERERVALIRLDVDSVQDHGQPTFEVEAGVRWRWTDAEAERADAELRSALRALG
jgi:Pyridoxamine 5'-phosphate oxidase